MKHLYLLLVACLISSCGYFQMERRTSEVILEEEISAIDWEEVDAYPVFSACREVSDTKQLDCFVTTLHNKIAHGVQRYTQEHSSDSLAELNIQITIDKDKKLSFTADTIALHSSVNLPDLLANIQKGLDSLQIVEPAFKRGIPVTTKFVLPIRFTHEEQ